MPSHIQVVLSEESLQFVDGLKHPQHSLLAGDRDHDHGAGFVTGNLIDAVVETFITTHIVNQQRTAFAGNSSGNALSRLHSVLFESLSLFSRN